jgi:cytochrome c-type biogenesis protein CcmH
MEPTDWAPGLAVLAFAAALGALVAWRSGRRGGASPQGDLAARKLSLVEALREVEDLRSTMEPAVYARERARLEGEAVTVMKAMDGAAPAEAPRAPAPGWADAHPRLIGVVGGVLLSAFVGAVVWGLQRDTAPRAEMGRPAGPDIPALKAAAEAAPDDLAAQNALAHAYLTTEDGVMDAFKISEAVVARDADNAEARTHQAVVLLAIGDRETAARVLDRVIASHPDFPEALGYRGAIYLDAGDPASAAATWSRAQAADPANASRFAQLVLMAKARAAAGGPGEAAGPDAPSEIEGTVTLAEGVAEAEGVLYIYARAGESGPPARVKRIANPTFPLDFALGPGDSPMGGALPASVTVSARVDRDGNPSTRDDTVVSGKVDGVTSGAEGVAIVLRATP